VVRTVFIVAGVLNIVGIPLFSLGFTNSYLVELYPEVFSTFSLFTIMLWGLAYLVVANRYRELPLIVLVFALEKLGYGITWLPWLARHGSELGAILDRSWLTGTFYCIYGPIDLGFGLVFAWAYFKAGRRDR
jgi:hypothetical protein